MLRFWRMRSLQKFASVHNHFPTECHILTREHQETVPDLISRHVALPTCGLTHGDGPMETGPHLS